MGPCTSCLNKLFKPPDIGLICTEGKSGELEAILSRYPDLIHVRVASGLTALHVSCYNGHVDCARILLAKGADVNAADKAGDTPLAYCFLDSPLHSRGKDGKKEIVDLLIKYQADANMKDGLTGETFLHKAISGGHVNCAHMLLSKNVDINAVNSQGDTALHIACADGHHTIVQALLAMGAKLHIKNRQGQTVLHKACALGHIGTVCILIEADVPHNDVNTKDIKGQTCLHVACAYNHSELAIMLIEEFGALKHETDNNGRQPAQLFVAQPGDEHALVRKSMILDAISVHKQEVMAAEGRANSPRGSNSATSSPLVNGSPQGSPKSRRGSFNANQGSGKTLTPVGIGAATPPSGEQEKRSLFNSIFSSGSGKKKK